MADPCPYYIFYPATWGSGGGEDAHDECTHPDNELGVCAADLCPRENVDEEAV